MHHPTNMKTTVYDLFYDLLHGYTYSSYTQVIDLIGVDDGVWTHDRWNHNPELYQLSYAHHWLSWHARQESNLQPSA